MTGNEVLERRRLQNRIAQRRFRQKHSKKKTTTPPAELDQVTCQEPNIRTHHVFDRGAWPETDVLSRSSNQSASTSTNSNKTAIIMTNDSAGTMYNLGLYTPPVSNTDMMQHPDALSVSLETVLSDMSTNLQALKPAMPNPPSSDLTSICQESMSTMSHSTPVENMMATPSGSSPSDSLSPRGEGGGWVSTLHIAAQRGHEGIVRMLLEHAPDCNERDSDGLTALMHAVIHGHESVVALLLEHGARPGDGDNRRQSALYWAVVQQNEAVLRILLEHCAREEDMSEQIDTYDNSFRTPLHTAVELGFEAGVRLLLHFGANLHCRARKLN